MSFSKGNIFIYLLISILFVGLVGGIYFLYKYHQAPNQITFPTNEVPSTTIEVTPTQKTIIGCKKSGETYIRGEEHCCAGLDFAPTADSKKNICLPKLPKGQEY